MRDRFDIPSIDDLDFVYVDDLTEPLTTERKPGKVKPKANKETRRDYSI